jgi:hypothetical protein
LGDLWGQPDPHDALGGAVTFSQPLPVYRLSLNDIGEPNSINKAELTGWRYLLEKGGGSAYADLVERPNKEQEFASLAENKNAERLNQAAHLAEQVAENLPDCEARILDVPALSIAALWLFGRQSSFIPYIDPEKLTGPNPKVSVDDQFLPRVTRRAEELKQQLPEAEPRLKNL